MNKAAANIGSAAVALKNFRSSIHLLRSRRFGIFWFASLLSSLGTWAQQVAQPWLLVSLGASPFLIGLDTFALGAPVLFLTLTGGVLADRADRRRVISLFQSIQMLCPTLLVVLLLLGIVQPWIVIGLSLIVGITDALSLPSFQTIVQTIVTREQIPAALALNSTQYNVSRVVGPAIAGVLLVALGAIGCFAVSAVSYLPFILVAVWILPKRTSATSIGSYRDVQQGVSSILRLAASPDRRGALLTVLVTNLLCAQLVTFAPVLVKSVFVGDALQFSVAIGAFGVGGLAGAISLLFASNAFDRRRGSSIAASLYGVVVVLSAYNPSYWMFVVLLVGAGFAMSISNISVNTLLQSGSEANNRGRVISLYMLAMRGGLSVGSLLTGISVTAFGVRNALLINGVLAIGIQLFVGRRWLRLTRNERNPGPATPIQRS